MKGYIWKRGAKWAYTVDIGKDPRTGKRKQKSKSGFRTKKEAQAALAELMPDINKGRYVEPNKTRFKDFAIEYLEKTYKNKVKASTYDRTYSIVLNQIAPWFGKTELKDLDQFIVHDFYNDKIEEGLSSAYIRRIHEIIRMLLRTAYKWQLIQKDIASLIEPPRLVKKEMKVWSIVEVNAFLKHTKHSRYHPVFFLAAHTGMRKGEILGLSWDDVDFKEKKINVNKTLYRIKGEYLLHEPKTKKSMRPIYFDDETARVLKRQKVRQNLERLKYGGVYKEHNMVFAQETGEFVNPHGVNGLFARFIGQANLPVIRFHDLRHTHATILLQMGVNTKLVADRLGHSSVKLTLDTYSHVIPSMQQDLSEQFSKVMKSDQNVIK